MRGPMSDRIGYFGKIPARSDFVKLAHDGEVMDMLDQWLARVMSRLPSDPRWKLNYDALAPVSFAFVGPAHRHAVAGHLVPSHDQSGRRFPFLMMRAYEVGDPPVFVARSPLAFAPLWRYLAQMAPRVLDTADPGPLLQMLAEAPCALGPTDDGPDGPLRLETVASLSNRLGGVPVERVVLALGLLLQPVMHSKPAALHKSLVLPLPPDPGAQAWVAAFWLALVAPFAQRAGFDLALFLTWQQEQAVLVIGFGGAADDTLRGLIDPLVAREQQIGFADTRWVDEQLGLDVDVRALASYLDQPQLPLNLALELFLKTFIGAAS